MILSCLLSHHCNFLFLVSYTLQNAAFNFDKIGGEWKLSLNGVYNFLRDSGICPLKRDTLIHLDFEAHLNCDIWL